MVHVRRVTVQIQHAGMAWINTLHAVVISVVARACKLRNFSQATPGPLYVGARTNVPPPDVVYPCERLPFWRLTVAPAAYAWAKRNGPQGLPECGWLVDRIACFPLTLIDTTLSSTHARAATGASILVHARMKSSVQSVAPRASPFRSGAPYQNPGSQRSQPRSVRGTRARTLCASGLGASGTMSATRTN